MSEWNETLFHHVKYFNERTVLLTNLAFFNLFCSNQQIYRLFILFNITSTWALSVSTLFFSTHNYNAVKLKLNFIVCLFQHWSLYQPSIQLSYKKTEIRICNIWDVLINFINWYSIKSLITSDIDYHQHNYFLSATQSFYIKIC